MIRDLVAWSIKDIVKRRENIDFPEFQRKPSLWNKESKKALIDSILCDIDIPKLYLYEEDKYYVIDGQQRLWAIWEFIDDEYAIKIEDKEMLFSQLPKELKEKIENYELQIVILKKVEEEYLRKLFLRLQLGLLLKPGEKLNALTGKMKDFIFNDMKNHDFVKNLIISNERYQKETLCAQICINSFYYTKLKIFTRTRFEDLQDFIVEKNEMEEKEFEIFKNRVISVLDELNKHFTGKSILRNKSLILSIYLYVEINNVEIPKKMKTFVEKLTERLKEEAAAGFERKNEDLYKFESYLSNAPGEKYQIKRRHDKFTEMFKYFEKNDKIMGDS